MNDILRLRHLSSIKVNRDYFISLIEVTRVATTASDNVDNI